MFCPNSADWGNVADWFAGIGSIIVGGGALYVAMLERARARRAEERISEIESERISSLLLAGGRLIETVLAAGLFFVKRVEANDDPNGAKLRWVRFVRTQQTRAARLLEFPISDPLIFSGIDAFVTHTTLPIETETTDPRELLPMASEINQKLKDLRKGMNQLWERHDLGEWPYPDQEQKIAD